jgi:hypothetical protein
VNSKAKGSRRERQTIRLLEASGYACIKAGASLGVFDVIGISRTDFIAVQVKSNRWPSEAETESIRLFPVPTNCRKLIHRWRDRQRTPDVRELGA